MIFCSVVMVSSNAPRRGASPPRPLRAPPRLAIRRGDRTPLPDQVLANAPEVRNNLLADRGYDADWIRALAAEKCAWANIPPRSNRRHKIALQVPAGNSRARVAAADRVIRHTVDADKHPVVAPTALIAASNRPVTSSTTNSGGTRHLNGTLLVPIPLVT